MWWRKKQETGFGFQGQPVVVNPADRERLDWAEWRTGTILRDRQGRQPHLHQQHAQMTAEAMSLAYALLGSGRWTQAQFDAYKKELGD